jgi:hypothetical protein
LHLDLRLAGFADIQSLYTILSQQMEFFFARFATMSGGYKVFDEDARNFKVIVPNSMTFCEFVK